MTVLRKKGSPTPWKEILKEVGVELHTCRMIDLGTKREGSPSHCKRSGRPPSLKEYDIQRIISYTTHDRNTRRMPGKEIRDNLGLLCHPSCILDILASYGYDKRTPGRKWGIRVENQEKRVCWCQDKLGWSHNDWFRTVWCDESFFSTAGFGSRPPVIRNAEEEYHPDCLDEVWDSGSTGVMVWGRFSGHLKSDLVFVDGQVTINSEG
ncbi:hypothetical protein HOY82DRAFT_537039 [Tuber indicum]|nr:hypothetical protein HOY82DRAFT_537039 [Tuber indicum]